MTKAVSPKSRAALRESLRLKIDSVVESSEHVLSHVRDGLSKHTELEAIAESVVNAAKGAKQVAKKNNRLLGWHRIPAVFLMLSLALFGIWLYRQFFSSARIVVAVSARDAVKLKTSLSRRSQITLRETEGSTESIGLLNSGKAQLAFVQGGIEIPEEMLRTELESSEVVLLFLKDGITEPSKCQHILTSSKGQGSHTVAKIFAKAWGIEDSVKYTFEWRKFTGGDRAATEQDLWTMDPGIDAVFVVVDPMSTSLDGVALRLKDLGFRLVEPSIGAMSLRLPFLKPAHVPQGFLDPVSHLPQNDVATYSVATYLVGRPDLTPAQLGLADEIQEASNRSLNGTSPSLSTATEVVQGVEATFGIVVYIGLAFLALLGLDVVAYRRHFNELNTMVSLISMHQSSRDVIHGTPEERSQNVAYLGVCSDLLGLIAVITGYYAQENSSLLYNRMVEIIQDRCNGLKINIQLKVLQAAISLPQPRKV
ncbi:MAG: hypothetical protein JNM43_01910 [Planctomycetaceae bacterium]|nr:hypothetical protein [Planctomycetaceae bacterium]